MRINKIYADFFDRTKNEPLIFLRGSRRSGKSVAILQNEYQHGKRGRHNIQCIAKTSTLLDTGIVSDFENILKFDGIELPQNKSKKEYYINESRLRFLSINRTVNAADIARTMGAATRRFINECNNFDKATIENLLISAGNMFGLQTQSKVTFDYNPTSPFWASEYETPENTLVTTWRDNALNLSDAQIKQFLEWERIGKMSDVGTPERWRYDVICCGRFSSIFGRIFSAHNIHFGEIKKGAKRYIFIDPATARNDGDYLACVVGYFVDNKLYITDTYSENNNGQGAFVEWLQRIISDGLPTEIYSEVNGEIGIQFYRLLTNNNIKILPYTSNTNKFDRIMAKYDYICDNLIFADTENNREFANQIYAFDEKCSHDDNIDAVCSLLNIGLIKKLIVNII